MSSASASPITVDFMSRFTASEQFDKVFREGMGLVEETANYLDGPGRQDARLLNGAEQLPPALNDIVERSLSLHQRVLKFDAMLNIQAKADVGAPAPSPVSTQLDRLAAVFGARS